VIKQLLIIAVLFAVGTGLLFVPAEWVGGGGPVAQAIIVRESAEQPNMTREQLIWLNAADLRAKAKTAGIELLLLDAEVVGRDEKTPEELKEAFAVAPPLPSLVIKRGSSYSRIDLPANREQAEKALGL
jgi:hypothetical protein